MTASSQMADFLIIGAGIAGASVAWWLSKQGRVLVLEAEEHPGYHSTGRSAAMFMSSYGPAQVRALTRASEAFLRNPPGGFGEHPLVRPRSALIVGEPGDETELARWSAVLAESTDQARHLDADEACRLVPVLRRERIAGAVFDPDPADIDVHALHQGFLRGLRRQGGRLICGARVEAIERRSGRWLLRAGQQDYAAPVLINAAGAWADDVAALAGVEPIGLEPRRRSAFVFAPPAQSVEAWPMVIGCRENWYMKPDAGVLLGSPANADPVPPQDVQPEELDIALGIDAIMRMTTLSIRRPIRTWAGLRSFVADGDLVGGFDAQSDGFFWLAGQGGYGIQSCAAMGEACAALASGRPIPAHLADHGIDAALLSPTRLVRGRPHSQPL